MTFAKPLHPVLIVCAVLAGCAQTPPGESPVHQARMKEAGDAYLTCLSREAEKDMKNPAGAEDIAAAAHGRCWSAWSSYKDAAGASFSHNARTSEEKQFAHDRAEAHLRDFEREARRSVVDSVAERSLKGSGSAR